MLNITAYGNLDNDPEVKYLESGNLVTRFPSKVNFSLAVRTGKDETTWLKCTVWGKRAQTAAEYLRKGAKITIAGQGKLKSYTRSDGTEEQSLNVNVTNFTLPACESNAMTEQPQIPIEKALNLVEFEFVEGAWRVKHVKGDVYGDVHGDVWINVRGRVLGDVRSVEGDVLGHVRGNVWSNVGGTINGRKWQFVETPKEKLKRLIDEGAGKAQLVEAINQQENN